MTKTLRIEVTPAMGEAAAVELYSAWCGVHHEHVRRLWPQFLAETRDQLLGMATAALTAAFQHPEFVEQIRQQVVACVPERRGAAMSIHGSSANNGFNLCIDRARANLAGLLGVGG